MVDRTWFRYRVRESELDPAGGFVQKEYTTSEGLKFPTDEEGLKQALIQEPYNLMLENQCNCATVRFDWERTREIIRYGIIAYRVDWDYKVFKGHYTNHENELYYVFLEPEAMTMQILDLALGNTAYRHVSADTVTLKQIVINMHLHLQQDGRYVVQPDPIMGTVATAIGLRRIEVVRIGKTKTEE